MKKRILFIDRDGTLIKEPPVTFQVDTLEQLGFLPGVIRNLYSICTQTDFELVMVTNQDGLGTPAYPEENFNMVQNKMLEIFSGEGIDFTAIHIDRSFEHEAKDTRKPGTGMLLPYIYGNYDLANSYVIGDRITDVQLAANLGCKAIFICNNDDPGPVKEQAALITGSWNAISAYLLREGTKRHSVYKRTTTETDIEIELDLDGTGKYDIQTGIGFFDHMLEQLAKHSGIDLSIKAKGDLHIDEHHTIEDTAIALGTAFSEALGNKAGIERYGYCLPMDDALAQVALDFGGRSWLVWDLSFQRTYIGDMPTEMFYHFFKSFCDTARCNLNVQTTGQNDHHKIEAVFKAFARAVKQAIRKDGNNNTLPTTKGIL